VLNNTSEKGEKKTTRRKKRPSSRTGGKGVDTLSSEIPEKSLPGPELSGSPGGTLVWFWSVRVHGAKSRNRRSPLPDSKENLYLRGLRQKSSKGRDVGRS